MTQAIQDELADALKEERLALCALARDASGVQRGEAFRCWQRAAERVSAASRSLKLAKAGRAGSGAGADLPSA